jgi:signal transduction histidine kinase
MAKSPNKELTAESLFLATKSIAGASHRFDLAKALLEAAMKQTAACRGAVAFNTHMEARGEGTAEDNFRFVVSSPAGSTFQLPDDLRESVLRHREVILDANDKRPSAVSLNETKGRPDVTPLCIPLVRERSILGLLYLESTDAVSCFTADRVAAASMLALQAALALESFRKSDELEVATRGRRAAEETLRETHNALLKHQEIGRMGDFRYNTRTRVSFGSRECYKLFGYNPDLSGIDFSTWTTKIIDEDRQRIIDELADCVANLRPLKFEYRIDLNGELRHIACVGQVDVDHQGDAVYYGVLTDITERKNTEQMFRQMQLELDKAQRFASLGELAGSIIHEINQPIAAIITSAEAGLRWLAREPLTLSEAQSSLQQVIEGGRRAALVVDGLKNLARSSKLRLEKVDVNALLAEVLALVKPDLDRGRILLSINLDPAVPAVNADRVKLQQVVLNLIHNSIDALAEIKGRASVLSVVSTFGEADEVRVTVSDNGEGIDPGVMGHLFDALYTTKNQGLGLGLSISRTIVSAHGGRIWVNDNEPHGATFSVSLPLSAKREENAAP